MRMKRSLVARIIRIRLLLGGRCFSWFSWFRWFRFQKYWIRVLQDVLGCAEGIYQSAGYNIVIEGRKA